MNNYETTFSMSSASLLTPPSSPRNSTRVAPNAPSHIKGEFYESYTRVCDLKEKANHPRQEVACDAPGRRKKVCEELQLSYTPI